MQMSNYPALPDAYTDLRRQTVATRCVCCGARLADTKSASIGAGPTCRKRLGLDTPRACSDAANDLIARAALAAEGGHLQLVQDYLDRLKALDPGYTQLIEKVQKRLFKTTVTPLQGGYLITSTYNLETVSAFKGIGLWWQPAHKAWRAWDSEQLNGALEVLADAIPGGDVVTPTGEIKPLATWRM
jgi:hypothetical protein